MAESVVFCSVFTNAQWCCDTASSRRLRNTQIGKSRLPSRGRKDCYENKFGKGPDRVRFDDFLREQGRYDESTNQAVKRVIAHQLAAAMEAQELTKSAFARKLKTNRSQLNRLLDPENTKVTIDALSRAAHAVGRELQLGLR